MKQTIIVISILFLFGCSNDQDNIQAGQSVFADNTQTKNVKALINQYAEWKNIQPTNIEILSIEEEKSIGKIEALATIHTANIDQDVYFKLVQGNSEDDWFIVSVGRKENGEIKYNDVYPFINAKVIEARKHLGS